MSTGLNGPTARGTERFDGARDFRFLVADPAFGFLPSLGGFLQMVAKILQGSFFVTLPT